MILTKEETKKRIVNQLFWDSRVDASEITVDFADGRVVLSGIVPSYIVRRAAESDAYIVEGVNRVENKIQVRYPTAAPQPSDSEIRANILNILSWDASIDAGDISVEVDNGVATLLGSVDTYWKKQRAEEQAIDIGGVTRVVNELTVVPTKRLMDQAIADDIVAALDRNALIDTEAVDVKVENGVVTLSGTVPNWNALQGAEEAATFTSGVVDIINNLIIAG